MEAAAPTPTTPVASIQCFGGNARVSWTDTDPAGTQWELERQIDAGGFNLISYDSALLFDDGLVFCPSGSTSIEYRVKRALPTPSSYSNTVSLTGTFTGTDPAATPVLALECSSGDVMLRWSETTPTFTTMSIERKIGAASFAQIATRGTGVYEYLDTAVACPSAGSVVQYRVRRTAPTVSSYSNIVERPAA